jgi:hypothetical protein
MFKHELIEAEKELMEYEALEGLNGVEIFHTYRGVRYYDWVMIEETRHEAEVLRQLTPELRKAYLRLCKATR